MDWWQHAIMGVIYATPFLLLAWWLDSALIGALDVIALLAYDIPDQDARKVRRKDVPFMTKETKHRHWFWHSSILPIAAFLAAVHAGQFAGVGTFCAVIASHLLSDIKFRGGKAGYYCIYLRHGSRMSARGTDLYLAANGLICILLGVFSLFL